MRPLRVGIDARWLHIREPIAYNRYLLGLLRVLQRDPSIKLFLFTDERRPLHSAHVDGLRVSVITLPGPRELIYEQVYLPTALRRHRIDVFHAPADYGLPAVKVCSYVLTCHGSSNELYFNHMLRTGQLPGTLHDYIGDVEPPCLDLRDRYRRVRKTLQHRLSIRRADRIIAVSEATKWELKTFFGLSEHKIRLIYEAPDSFFLQGISKDEIKRVLRKYRLPERYLFSVSSLAKLKNTDGLLRVYAALRRNGTDAALVLCGVMVHEFATYKMLARELGLQEQRDLFFLKNISDGDLRALYQSATVFVLLSWYEAFSFPVVEAMVSGAPVIVSNFSCLPETVGDGGIPVDPRRVDEVAQTIKRVLDSPQLQQELRQRGLARVEAFSWEKAAQQTLSVYNELWTRRSG